MWRKGDLKCPERLKNKLTIIGSFDNPIIVATNQEVYKCLDSEFYAILGIYKWIESGLVHLTVEDLSYGYALAIKYLIEYNKILNKESLIG